MQHLCICVVYAIGVVEKTRSSLVSRGFISEAFMKKYDPSPSQLSPRNQTDQKTNKFLINMQIIYDVHVQPQFITTTQHITINATYHNWSRNMSQLTQIVTILTQNVTTQQRNLSQKISFFFSQHVTT